MLNLKEKTYLTGEEEIKNLETATLQAHLKNAKIKTSESSKNRQRDLQIGSNNFPEAQKIKRPKNIETGGGNLFFKKINS